MCNAATSGCSRTAGSATRPSADAGHGRRRVGVAFSGGLDSTALLHATVAAAVPLGVDVVAMHVHHRLSPEADAWLMHAQELCGRWARRGQPVTLAFRHLVSSPARGDSVEAWARDGRYDALRSMARESGLNLVLLAHHRRDQAETFLLQALRGAGPSGLAAMPRSAHEGGVSWARPWLDMPREAIEAYARRHRLGHVDDASNRDRRYARNRLRLDVWPQLIAAFPDAESTLAAASRAAADARAVLKPKTAADLEALVDGDALHVPRLRLLPLPQRRHVLVVWLRARLGAPAPRTLVERLAIEIDGADATRWPAPGGRLQRRANRLAYIAEAGVEGTPR